MKKFLAVLISLCMLSLRAVPVFADANSNYIALTAYQAQIAAKWDVFHDLEAVKAKVEEQCPGYCWNSGAPVHLFALFRKRS